VRVASVRFGARIAVLALSIAIAVPACTISPTAPSSTQPFKTTDLVVGSGAAVVPSDLVAVDYTGWLYDAKKPDFKGLKFDSSVGGQPLAFIVGNGEVINGWEIGVPGMQVGGTRRLVIPPSLAYGPERSGIIPPNATLVFDITLISINDLGESAE
jgi:FKBP-type peptidyl-prolyl cis-trans isomerase FkpA